MGYSKWERVYSKRKQEVFVNKNPRAKYVVKYTHPKRSIYFGREGEKEVYERKRSLLKRLKKLRRRRK